MTGFGTLSLKRGFIRLAIAAAVIWFVFWTSAYVITPFTTLHAEPSFAERVTAWSVVVPTFAAALILGIWLGVGFRPK